MEKAWWEHFNHGSDIGVRGVGGTPGEAFEQAALALTGVVVYPGEVSENDQLEIVCEAEDQEWLFYEWLGAIVYEMATRKMLFARYEVRLSGNRLQAHAWGEAVEPARHQPAVEVKGVTLTELKVDRLDDGRWIAQCVVDV